MKGITTRGVTTRKTCSIWLAVVLATIASEAQPRMKVLAIVAHPDDEYAFAATSYRIARELGGIVDQVIISNGEAGYRYSSLAQQIYGLQLTDEEIGRANLPEIRKQESLEAGRILGIRQHHFLDQKDSGFTLDPEAVNGDWDKSAIRALLSKLLQDGNYSFVFTLLPTTDTHGQHIAATLLTLEAVAALPVERKPVVFGVEPAASRDRAREFTELRGYPLTRTGREVHEFRRSNAFGFHDALNYQIVANWVIAAHKSQGLFQMDASRHDLERFWRFEVSGPTSADSARGLFKQLSEKSVDAVHLHAGTYK